MNPTPEYEREKAREEGRREVYRLIVAEDPAVYHGSGVCRFCGGMLFWDLTPKEEHLDGCLWLRAQQACGEKL
jgi:hypothetical protein